MQAVNSEIVNLIECWLNMFVTELWKRQWYATFIPHFASWSALYYKHLP